MTKVATCKEKVNMSEQLSSGATDLNFGWSLHSVYFVHVSNKGSGETAHYLEACWSIPLGSYMPLPFLYPATKVWRGIMLYPSVSVRLSVRPCSPFPIDNLSIYSRNFSNFAYLLLSAMSGMGLLMGKIRPFLTELLPFFILEKWFLACYSFTVHDI